MVKLDYNQSHYKVVLLISKLRHVYIFQTVKNIRQNVCELMFFVMLGIEYYYLLEWRHAQILQGKRRKLPVSLTFPFSTVFQTPLRK
jgi:hypothetical protein